MDVYPILKIRNRRNAGRVTNRYAGQRSFPAAIGPLRRIKQDIAVTSEILSQEQVWPDQCDYILQLFDGITQTTESFLEYLNSRSARTRSLEANRYSILADACFFSSQVERVKDITREFAQIGGESRKRKSKHKQMNRLLQQLRSSFNHLINEIDRLFENS